MGNAHRLRGELHSIRSFSEPPLPGARYSPAHHAVRGLRGTEEFRAVLVGLTQPFNTKSRALPAGVAEGRIRSPEARSTASFCAPSRSVGGLLAQHRATNSRHV